MCTALSTTIYLGVRKMQEEGVKPRFEVMIGYQHQKLTDLIEETLIQIKQLIQSQILDIRKLCWLAKDIILMAKTVPSAVHNDEFYDMSFALDPIYKKLSLYLDLNEKSANVDMNIDDEVIILKHLTSHI